MNTYDRWCNTQFHETLSYELTRSFAMEVFLNATPDFNDFIADRYANCETVDDVKRSFGSLVWLASSLSSEHENDATRFLRAGFHEKIKREADHRIYEIEQAQNANTSVTKTEREVIPNYIRIDVLAGGKCAYCDSPEKLQVDHIVPLAKGGNNHRANLQALCESCNKSKNCKREAEIIRELKTRLDSLETIGVR